MKNVILTGDRPTGRLHIGHYVGSLKQRVELQNTDYDKFFIMIADAQALTDNYGNPSKVRHHIIEVMLDYLSVGLEDLIVKTKAFQLVLLTIRLVRQLILPLLKLLLCLLGMINFQ